MTGSGMHFISWPWNRHDAPALIRTFGTWSLANLVRNGVYYHFEISSSGGNKLKEKIHPNYTESKVSCACGEAFETRSTNKTIKVDICSKCHPFFTGREKLLDAEGRVEKFKRKYAKK
jgi:large subunit ribosomal protein L31